MTTTRDELRENVLREDANEHQPDDHGPDICGDPDCFTTCVVDGCDWPCATAWLRDQLDAAEHRIARLGAQSAIRGRAVAIYQARAREAEARVTAWEKQYAHDTERLWQELDDTDARIKAVRELHTPEPGLGTEYCCDCEQMMPCETLRALDGDA